MQANPTPLLPTFITEFLLSVSQEQKNLILSLINDDEEGFKDAIEILPKDHLTEPLSTPSTESITPKPISPPPFPEPKFSDLVKHVQLDLPEPLVNGVMKELATMKIRTVGKKVKTLWLSPSNESYKYERVVNKPKPINEFPKIVELMNLVNSKNATSGNMTACLVSCMSCKAANLSYHDDNEPLIDQGSDICTVSFGATRKLDFIRNINNPSDRRGTPPPPEFSVPATDQSLNIMKAGCQSRLLHRVPPGPESGVRYSLSFRNLADPLSTSTSSPPPHHSSTPPHHPPPPNTGLPLAPPKKKIILLAGDSYFERLEMEKLAKGKQTVFKVAKGGRKIDAVLHSIEQFVRDHPDLELKKLFVCVGTNDIRYCQTGILHLKSPLQNFMSKIKSSAPSAKIFVQSLLPIPANGNPKGEQNVVSMNKLLFSLFSKFKLFYLDVFSSFLSSWGDRNYQLFSKYSVESKKWDIHPNARGMGVLARHYIFLIH